MILFFIEQNTKYQSTLNIARICIVSKILISVLCFIYIYIIYMYILCVYVCICALYMLTYVLLMLLNRVLIVFKKKFESHHLNSSWMPQHLAQSLAHSRYLISIGCTYE